MGEKDFQERLVLCMQKSKYTQTQLAQLVGVSEAAFSRYVNGERMPTATILNNIATALATTSDYLLTGKEPFADFAQLRGLVARGATSISAHERKELITLIESINRRKNGTTSTLAVREN